MKRLVRYTGNRRGLVSISLWDSSSSIFLQRRDKHTLRFKMETKRW